MFSLCMKFKIVKFMEAESKMMVIRSRGRRKWGGNVKRYKGVQDK